MVVDPQVLFEALMLWITEGLGIEIGDDELQAIIINGKTLRGTREQHRRAYQTLVLLDQKTGFALSETPVDPTTNEAKTGLKLLQEMVLEGKIMVGDAAYCDQEICREIVDSGGDDLVLVKDNQPTLHKPAQQAFAVPRCCSPPTPSRKRMRRVKPPRPKSRNAGVLKFAHGLRQRLEWTLQSGPASNSF